MHISDEGVCIVLDIANNSTVNKLYEKVKRVSARDFSIVRALLLCRHMEANIRCSTTPTGNKEVRGHERKLDIRTSG